MKHKVGDILGSNFGIFKILSIDDDEYLLQWLTRTGRWSSTQYREFIMHCIPYNHYNTKLGKILYK